MRYIVTGVSGFIGSYLKEKLILSGHEVIGISRRENHEFDSSSYTHISVDLSDKNSFEPIVSGLLDKLESDGFIHTKLDKDGDKELIPISEVIAESLRDAIKSTK